MKKLLTIFICVYFPLVYVCTKNIAGTETTNGDQITITTKVNCIEGSAPSGYEVHIYADDFYPYNDSGFRMNVIVNDSGKFRFGNLKAGNYNFYCKSGVNDSSVFVQMLQVGLSDNLDTDTVAFTGSGVVEGVLIDTLSKPVVNAYAFIKGSPFFAPTNKDGAYSFSNIPGGKYSMTFTNLNWDRNSIKGPGISISVDVYDGRKTEMGQVIYK